MYPINVYNLKAALAQAGFSATRFDEYDRANVRVLIRDAFHVIVFTGRPGLSPVLYEITLEALAPAAVVAATAAAVLEPGTAPDGLQQLAQMVARGSAAASTIRQAPGD